MSIIKLSLLLLYTINVKYEEPKMAYIYASAQFSTLLGIFILSILLTLFRLFIPSIDISYLFYSCACFISILIIYFLIYKEKFISNDLIGLNYEKMLHQKKGIVYSFLAFMLLSFLLRLSFPLNNLNKNDYVTLGISNDSIIYNQQYPDSKPKISGKYVTIVIDSFDFIHIDSILPVERRYKVGYFKVGNWLYYDTLGGIDKKVFRLQDSIICLECIKNGYEIKTEWFPLE